MDGQMMSFESSDRAAARLPEMLHFVDLDWLKLSAR